MEPPIIHFRAQIGKNTPCTYWTEPPLVSCTFLLPDCQKLLQVLLEQSCCTFQLSDLKEPKVIFNAARWPWPRPISRKPSLLILASVLLLAPNCCWRPDCCWFPAVVAVPDVAGPLLLLASFLLLVTVVGLPAVAGSLLLLASFLFLFPVVGFPNFRLRVMNNWFETKLCSRYYTFLLFGMFRNEIPNVFCFAKQREFRRKNSSVS